MDSTTLRVGSGPVLLVDRRLIAASSGVTQRWHEPERHAGGPLIEADRPWEQTPYFTYSNYHVMRDPADGRIKCFYEDLGEVKPHGKHPALTRLLLAESEDGLHFHKPELDVVEHEGRPTNIVMGYALGQPASSANPWAEQGVHSNGVVIDPHAERPDERWRTIFTRYTVRDDGSTGIATQCAHSPDGIHWQPYDQPPSIGTSGQHLGDVSCVFYDEDARLFVQNTRYAGMGHVAGTGRLPKAANWGCVTYPFQPHMENRRRVFQTHSHDFLHWSEPRLVAGPDDAIDNLDEYHYGMGQFRVGRHTFATLGVFRHVDSEMHVRLLHSDDGVRFSPLHNAQPWLAPRGEGYWDAHMVSLTSPPLRVGDRWHFYHGGTCAHHDWWMSGGELLDVPEAEHPAEHAKFGLGLATLRVNGFASIEACWPRPGWFQTLPLHTTGRRLTLNARCEPGGSIRVALIAPDGTVLQSAEHCDAFTGDAVEHTVTWNGQADLVQRGWQAVRFHLDRAEVFSLQFEG